MRKKPLVSILMGAYNVEKYISDSVQSVLNLKYENWELIIVDDKSTDNTFKVAQEFELKDERIKVYSNEKNLGDYTNRNQAAAKAKGKYLKYLDSDDMLYPYSLNYMVEAMEGEPEAGIALSFSKIDDNIPYPITVSARDTYREEFLNKGFLSSGPSAAIIRHEAFKKIGGFSGMPYVGDQELWLKISRQYSIIKLQPALIWYRIHPQQQTSSEKKDLNTFNVRYKISRQALEEGKSFFTEKEFRFAEKKMKQNHARLILRKLFKDRNILGSFNLMKKSKLSIREMFTGFKGYDWD